MFQYISEIIKNISPAQRFWALLITLVTITLVTLGDDLISAVNSSNSVLENKVNALETSNKSLQTQNIELQQLILKSQLDCTKDITQLRQQILDEITLLEKEMKQGSNPFVLRKVSEPRVGGSGSDTVVMGSTTEEVVQVRKNSEAMTHVKKLKQKLQKEIESSDL
jgi:hypothetical protein